MGGAEGPALSFRGLDDRGYYHRVDPTPLDHDEGELPAHARYDDTYCDVTGCGNTFAAETPCGDRSSG